MRGLLLLIGVVSTALANPVPEAHSLSQEYSDSSATLQEISTDENTSENELPSPTTNGKDDRIALNNVEDGNTFYRIPAVPTSKDGASGYENTGYGVTADSIDQMSSEDVNGYQIASDPWMTNNDKLYTDFSCNLEKSICCTGKIIGPVTQRQFCSNSEHSLIPRYVALDN